MASTAQGSCPWWCWFLWRDSWLLGPRGSNDGHTAKQSHHDSRLPLCRFLSKLPHPSWCWGVEKKTNCILCSDHLHHSAFRCLFYHHSYHVMTWNIVGSFYPDYFKFKRFWKFVGIQFHGRFVSTSERNFGVNVIIFSVTVPGMMISFTRECFESLRCPLGRRITQLYVMYGVIFQLYLLGICWYKVVPHGQL